MSQVANYKLGIVVIVAANGAIATKLRHLAPRLRDEFCRLNTEVTEVCVRVQACTTSPNPAPIKGNKLTPAAIQSLERLSATLDEDSALRQALDSMLRNGHRVEPV
jgi:hypothetical protein